ncbi:uncharacterized protein LOC103524116 [Trichonephila clavipes]|nr:uncharacterized protein LOC103524116 [Trichonephila clavipes]
MCAYVENGGIGERIAPTALHAIALETINTRFPPEEWLHIYTDGSLLDFAQGAGIGVFSHLFSFYLHAGPLTTHFDGEVEAIYIALQQLAVRLPPIERAVILSDSTSALQALSNYNENNCLRVQNCRELLGKMKGKIVFQWVPSHCGLWGNERADFLAKKGTGILQNFRRDLTLHSAKLEIKRIFRESFRLTASRVARDKPWSTLCKKSHGIPSSPRAAAVAKFRLLTGHDCLCAHLFRFNLVTSPICVLCDTGQDMTAAHLDECSALNDLNCIIRRRYDFDQSRRVLLSSDLHSFDFRPDGTNGNRSTRYYEQLRRENQIEALDIVINRCTELVNFPDTDDNHEMKAILRASIDDAQRKKDTMDFVEDFVFPKKTARHVSPLPSEPVTVNNSFSDLESENDKDQVAPEENNETAPPKPKPPPPIHLKIKKNIRDQLKSIYQKFPIITNKSSGEFIKLITNDIEEYHALTNFLEDKDFEFFSLKPKPTKPIKIVIKGLPIFTKTHEI